MKTAAQILELIDSFPWDDWQDKLQPDFTQVYKDAAAAIGRKAAAAHGVTFNVDDPGVSKHMTRYVGERVTQLSETSKSQVKAKIRSALEDADQDSSAQDLADLVTNTVRDTYDDYEQYRSLRIARTESAVVYNNGSVFAGIQSGFDNFDVVDGTDDDECADANGDVWTSDECLEDPIAHPNCVRAFFPHVDDDSGEEDDDETASATEKRRLANLRRRGLVDVRKR